MSPSAAAYTVEHHYVQRSRDAAQVDVLAPSDVTAIGVLQLLLREAVVVHTRPPEAIGGGRTKAQHLMFVAVVYDLPSDDEEQADYKQRVSRETGRTALVQGKVDGAAKID